MMIQGTASSVGKSFLVAALCRIFRQDGFRVAPFKAQNMSLNSFVTPEGGEIGRAQAVQAEAAGTVPHVDMNPVLLKPEGSRRCQVVLLGRPAWSLEVGDERGRRELWNAISGALERLMARYDVVVMEGAGSAVEPNLRDRDLANMAVAKHVGAPVLLVGDIDRGGVFAHLVGTLELLEEDERGLVRGFLVNKFRGDLESLAPAVRFLEARTGIPVVGVIPYAPGISLPEEDSVALEERRSRNRPGRQRCPEDGPESSPKRAVASRVLDIAVVHLPHTSNFDDFDPLEHERCVSLRYVRHAAELGDPDLVILPGTKATAADLIYLEASGLATAIVDAARRGTPVVGICGGYQMLGELICDPEGVESGAREVRGLGLFPAVTVFDRYKTTHQVEARVEGDLGLLRGCRGERIRGYEIHMGSTYVRAGAGSPGGVGSTMAPKRDVCTPFSIVRRSGIDCVLSDGMLSHEGLILGTYIHGIFHNASLRAKMLGNLAAIKGRPVVVGVDPDDTDEKYDALARLVRSHLDMSFIYGLLRLRV